jgi:hypothetical protein
MPPQKKEEANRDLARLIRGPSPAQPSDRRANGSAAKAIRRLRKERRLSQDELNRAATT